MAFLGCSRGLGRACSLAMSQQRPDAKLLLVSRQQQALQSLQKDVVGESEILSFDFSKSDELPSLIDWLVSRQPSRVFYFAAGGPYGLFAQKKWQDHEWALQVSLLTPMRLLHQLLQQKLRSVEQVVLVGSSVADNRADPMASSYTTAKHGLRGLTSTLQEEPTGVDIRFFRPGYMDTDLLPPGAPPRQQAGLVKTPEEAATTFIPWVLDPDGSKTLDF